METLAQMLEEYRRGERGLPSYAELVGLLQQPQGEAVAYAMEDFSDVVPASKRRVNSKVFCVPLYPNMSASK